MLVNTESKRKDKNKTSGLIFFKCNMNEQEKKQRRIKTFLIYAGWFLFILLLRAFIITPVVVNGSSMDPTLSDGEVMLLNKIGYTFGKINRFDIVVVNYNGDKLIKRVIGLPNEQLVYEDDTLYIDGRKIEEDYTREVTEDFKTVTKIADDCYFVMGDNRDNSSDSRVFGCVPKEDILGEANFVLFPFDKFGFKK